MIKRKAKGKTATKESGEEEEEGAEEQGTQSCWRAKCIVEIVESEAKKITEAVMDQAMTGQLAPAKYLFEMAEMYSQATDGSHPTVDEESLAATLFRRLDISEKPIMRHEEDAPQAVASVEKPTAMPADQDDEQDRVAEPKAGEEDHEPVPV
jgi:hypothetical protein